MRLQLTLIQPFAGMTLQDRVVMNYRIQWPAIPGAFNTYNFSYDRNLDLASSGIGVLLNHDVAGTGALSTTSLRGMYAYEFKVKRYIRIRAGLQAGFYRRFIDFNRLTFTDQLVRGGGSIASTEFFGGDPKNFFDFGVGGLAYGRSLWVGAAFHHLNSPSQALLGGDGPLPLRYSVHGGYRINLEGRSVGKQIKTQDIVVALNYKGQAKFDQIDVGFYYEPEPLVLGFWYRGIPLFKALERGYQNNDAFIFLVGVRAKNLKIGYSYDATISRLISNTGGSHEISLIYEWANREKQLKRRRKPVPCAKF